MKTVPKPQPIREVAPPSDPDVPAIPRTPERQAESLEEFPSERPRPTGTIESRLHDRIQVFEAAFSRTKATEDDEAIHDLRVATRRLVTFIRTWRELFPAPVRRRAVRDLRALRRRLNEARDLEVEVESLGERVKPQGVEGAPVRELLEDLKRRLERDRGRASERLRPKRTRRVLLLLAEAEHAIRADVLSQLQAFERAHGRERKRCHTAVGYVRQAMDVDDDAVLHQARIAVKKWRYTVESLGEIDSPRVGPMLVSLRGLQEVLGVINDRANLRESLRRRVREADDDVLTERLASMLETLEAERRVEIARFRDLAYEFLRGSTVVPAPAETPAEFA